MDGYNFRQDFFDTYQSLSNAMKALWLIVPAAFVLGLVALILRICVGLRKIQTAQRGDLVYTIHRDTNDVLHVTRHGGALDREPALVLLELGDGGDGGKGDVQRRMRGVDSRKRWCMPAATCSRCVTTA